MNINLSYETDWIVRGVLTSNNPIDINDSNFCLSFKDIFENFQDFTTPSDRDLYLQNDNEPTLVISHNVLTYETITDTDTICDDPTHPILLPKYIDNIEIYNNTSDTDLVRNGFQFWIDDDNPNKLIFRICARGVSDLNSSGYLKYGSTIPTGRVGFSTVLCVFTFDSINHITFKVSLLPRILQEQPKTDDDNDKDIFLSASESHDQQTNNSGNVSRADFTYDNTIPKGSLYVNNSTETYSASYSGYWDKTKEKYVTSSKTEKLSENGITPEYYVNVSAIIPTYLIEKGVNFDTESSASYLKINNYDFIELSAEYVSTGSATIDYFVDTYGNKINDDINFTAFKQHLNTSENVVKSKDVYFSMEIL